MTANCGEATANVAEMTATRDEACATNGEESAGPDESAPTSAEITAISNETTAISAEMTADSVEPTATCAEPTATRAEQGATRAETTATSEEATSTSGQASATVGEATPTSRGTTPNEIAPTPSIQEGIMQTAQGNMLESLIRVRTFLDENAERLASVVKTGSRTRLDESIAALTGNLESQGSSSIAARKSTRAQYARRVALLKDHMAVVARIARASLPNTPELAALRMPKGAPSLARLAAAAHEMANGAAPHADVFVSAGLPADFVANLKGAADAMLAARSERGSNTGRRAGATEALKAGLSAGRRIVRVLDALVKTAARGDAGLVADWINVSRVRKVTSVAAAAAAENPVVAPASPAATPASDALA